MSARNLRGHTQSQLPARHYTVADTKTPLGPSNRGVGRPGRCFAIEADDRRSPRARRARPRRGAVAETWCRRWQLPFTTVGGMRLGQRRLSASVRLCAELLDLPGVRARQHRASRRAARRHRLCRLCRATAHGAAEFRRPAVRRSPGFEAARADPARRQHGRMVGIQSARPGAETPGANRRAQLRLDVGAYLGGHGDTEARPSGFRTFASRSMVMRAGAVARRQPHICRDKLCRRGAHLLRVIPPRCACAEAWCWPAGVGHDRRDRPRRPPPPPHHLRIEGGLPPVVEPLLDATATYEPAIGTGVFSYATQGAVVQSTRTGFTSSSTSRSPRIGGTMVNPMIVEGQLGAASSRASATSSN